MCVHLSRKRTCNIQQPLRPANIMEVKQDRFIGHDNSRLLDFAFAQDGSTDACQLTRSASTASSAKLRKLPMPGHGATMASSRVTFYPTDISVHPSL